MNIQIFGTSKCFDTKKAQRYFKERGIKFQMIDLKEKGMSRGEFDNVARALGGVRCAVIPIILGAALRLREKSLTDKSSYVLAAIALFVCTFTKVNKILVVLGGAVFGLLALAVKRGGRHR